MVKVWFDLIEEFIVNAGVRSENIYKMDESGIQPGLLERQQVIGNRGTKIQHLQGGRGKEMVTALVAICADGTTTDPMIIFKGKQFMKKWSEDNVAHAVYVFMLHFSTVCLLDRIVFSENGWTDGGLARQWIEKVFDAQTKAKAGGCVRVLLLDGYSSHYSYSLLQYARTTTLSFLDIHHIARTLFRDSMSFVLLG